LQVGLGTLIPLLLLGSLQLARDSIPAAVRRVFYFLSGCLCLIGVLAMRWNVVIGGQLFSKSLRGLTTFSMEWAGHEGGFTACALLLLPFFILWLLLKFFLPANPPGTQPPLAAQATETTAA
jgi:Ni/Fe-hydrogenase subunit HybB-like protein